MNNRPTPETDKNALLLANLDDWIDDCLRNSKPIGLTLCDARKRISDQSDRIAELWDAMEIIRRERDEAIEKYNTLAVENMLEVHSLCKERDELRDILQRLIGVIPEPECNDFGHEKEEQHSLFEKCPVLERYDAIIKQAKSLLETTK